MLRTFEETYLCFKGLSLEDCGLGMRAVPAELLRGVFTTRRYTNPRLPCLYLGLGWYWTWYKSGNWHNKNLMLMTTGLDWARFDVPSIYRSYWGWVFTGQVTWPTVSEHWRKIGFEDQASIPSDPPHHAHNNTTTMQYKTKTQNTHR